MTILLLTAQELADLGGVDARFQSEIAQGLDINCDPVKHYKDLGLVRYGGYMYYAGLFTPPVIDEDN